jgi:hypothetical protein
LLTIAGTPSCMAGQGVVPCVGDCPRNCFGHSPSATESRSELSGETVAASGHPHETFQRK